ncbi:general substrate transporter [Aspergillus unguis]
MPSYTQIPNPELDSGSTPSSSLAPQNKKHHDSLRIYYLAAVVCTGGLLFGYDSGVIGGVLTFASFQHSFAYNSSNATLISSISVGIQQAGALAGCLLIWPLTNTLGRRKALMLCSLVFCIGVLFEIVNSHSLLLFYIGRVICGLGVGGSATVSPIYLAEMAPSHLRGRLGSGYQFTFTIGILVSYWIDYFLQFMEEGPMQWQIPLSLQLVPGLAMGVGMLKMKESVRWLLDRGDESDAWRSLVWVRSSSTSTNDNSLEEVKAEFAEMKRAVTEDSAATKDFSARELLRRPNLHRIFLAVTLFVAQQATGATAMAYFGPQFFSLLVGTGSGTETGSSAGTGEETGSNSLTLLLTGIFGFLKVTSCLFFVLFVADRYGRKPLLTYGALGMALGMVMTSILLSFSPSSPTPSPLISTLTISLIYLSIALYNLSWGPLPWPCVAEYFPTRLRSPGVAIAVASQWASNFVWSFATPYILRDLGSGTFLLFGVFCLGIAAFVWRFVPETRGLTLEEVQHVFDGDTKGGHQDGGGGGDGGEADWEEREGLVRDDENIKQESNVFKLSLPSLTPNAIEKNDKTRPLR